ncbi:MAG: indolepyruvate ferredoxin oxidoreductase subunit alpha [Christensenellaceae bacterium]|nr:indolepyruvate ferredoxin oxidoreductase subunit alpha [Christensenellaceae bacterium]MEA5067943.1 indolepyruvate ferredoxin oxidoreductase subunit alpha [Christensenellaceae bacterium]
MEKQLMLGNEAVARGAWEAGCRVVSSYPGTPSTEVTESAAKYPDMYCEWAVNEKVSLELCAGAAVAGARAMCAMKHVGVNVAADPLFTLSYTGVNGGLVMVAADDPGMHSSQNEQDSRCYARAAHLPLLEPADSQECLDFTALAFELSERFDAPVMLRLTTRVAHARMPVALGERLAAPLKPYRKDIAKYVMMPAMARSRHVAVEARMNALAEYAEGCPVNRVEMRDTRIGVISSGMAYQYVREALPEASVLKLGMVHPLPRRMIERFAASVDRLLVIEELEPVIEDQLAGWGIMVTGKALTGRQGELSVNRLRSVLGLPEAERRAMPAVPPRPPVMCAGCPHRGPMTVLKKLKLTVTGDIGCYTLGALAPVDALDTSLCMGASIGMAQGFERADAANAARTVAVIGDSTFLHTGVNALISAAFNQARTTVMILDNSITAMTGHQPNPNSGRNLSGERPPIDLAALCLACGVRRVRKVDAFDLAALEAALKEETAADELSVIIAGRPCALLDKSRRPAFRVDPEKCRGCWRCIKLSCPAISKAGKVSRIDEVQCAGCGLCVQTCPFGAIGKAGGEV